MLEIRSINKTFNSGTPNELRALGEDISKNGQISAVVLWNDRDGRSYLLDGRNRLDAMEAAGLSVVDAEGKLLVSGRRCGVEIDPYEYVISANVHRRHLTPEQKRDLIAKVLKAQPEKSNRIIAKQTEADHKTVGAEIGRASCRERV